MLPTQIAKDRISNQKIVGAQFDTVQETVGWLGAVQAQDYAMAKWAIGLRTQQATDAIVEQAINNADIIRTHVLRPTWHFVSKDDAYWMLTLTAPAVKSAAAFMCRKLELDDKVIRRSNTLIEKALRGGQHLIRAELMIVLSKAGIAANDIRASLIMLRAELDGIVCNGIKRGKQFTYALLAERVPECKEMERDEALAAIARRYFTSHGPATLKDFAWWSGLSATDAKAALEMVKPMLASEKNGTDTYWFSDDVIVETLPKSTLRFLPAFDELTISYKDRSASLDVAFAKQAIGGNGIFNPIIVLNGKVIGVWKRTTNKTSVLVTPTFFDPGIKISTGKLKAALKSYGTFLGLEPKLIY